MSYASNHAPSDFKPEQRVAYVTVWNGEREYGTVSSTNSRYVFVRFDGKNGSEACDPRDLVDATAGGAA